MVWQYSQRTSIPALASTSSIVTTADLDDVVRKICQDGCCPGLNLRREVIEQLLTFSSLATCYFDGNEDFPFHYRDRHEAQRRAGRQFRLGRYNGALNASQAFRALASDAQLLAIARKYLRTEPVFIGARMWWAWPVRPRTNKRQKQARAFITILTDIAAWHFFYLTDVGQAAGPHVYVRGTHIKKSWRHLFTLFKGRTDAKSTNPMELRTRWSPVTSLEPTEERSLSAWTRAARRSLLVQGRRLRLRLLVNGDRPVHTGGWAGGV
jgi:hypothetical protein